MGYWLLESMGYAYEIPTYQPGKWVVVWVIGEYGLSGVWVMREMTVVDTPCQTEFQRVFVTFRLGSGRLMH
jgi:hypothetical protein